MSKLQIFSFFMVLSFFGSVKGMGRKAVEAGKPIATKLVTSGLQEAATSTFKTGAPLALRGGVTSTNYSSFYSSSRPSKLPLSNQGKLEGSLISSRQFDSPLESINVQDAFNQQVQENTTFSGEQSQIERPSRSSKPNSIYARVLNTAPNSSTFNSQPFVNSLFQTGLSFNQPFSIRSSQASVQPAALKTVLEDQQHNQKSDQSQALQLYRSPSMPSSSEKFIFDPRVESIVSEHEQTRVPSWLEKLINSESVHQEAGAPIQSSDAFGLQKAQTAVSSPKKTTLADYNDMSSQSGSENLTQPRSDTIVGTSKNQSLSLQESSILSDPQTLVLPDHSTLIIARDGHAQSVFIVGDSQGQFGLVLTADNVLEFGFIDNQGQPSIVTITDPSILLDRNNPGIQSLLQSLPADIQALLPKFVASQAVQKVLQVALSPEQAQLNIDSDRTGQKMITAPKIQPLSNREVYQAPFGQFQSLQIQNSPINLASKDFGDFQSTQSSKISNQLQYDQSMNLPFQIDVKLPKVKPSEKSGFKFVNRTPLAKGEKTPLDLNEDIFSEHEIASSEDIAPEEVLEKDITLVDNVDPINEQPLPQQKKPVIPKNLETKIRQVADAEFHNLPKNSSKLAKILAMLQRIQEMIVNFVKSIGSYDSYADSLRQRQAMELAKKKAAQKLAAQKMNSATWLDIIQQFIAEIWAILTSKSLKESLGSVSENNIVE